MTSRKGKPIGDGSAPLTRRGLTALGGSTPSLSAKSQECES